MEKVELFKAAVMLERFTDHVHDRWMDWRMKEAGVDPENHTHEQWKEVLYSMPEPFEWYPMADGTMHIQWHDGSVDLPLDLFFDDEEDQPDLKMLWHCNYWDGPLSGVALYEGEHVWFELTDDDDYGDNRVFSLYRLNPEDKEEIFKQHKEFQEAVGYHTDHDPEVHKPYKCKDKKKFDDFYKKKRKELFLAKGDNYLTEFHWCQFQNWGRPRHED